MADILSQEEIDRLLTVAATEPAADVAELRTSELEALEKLARVLFASANSTLATLLARPASVVEGLGQVVNVGDLDTAASFTAVFPFRSGFSGEMAFLLHPQEASVLADLILGGEGSAKATLEESDRDALKEALSQIAGNGAPVLSATLGRETGFGAPRLDEAPQGDLARSLPWKHAFLAIGTIRVEGVLDAPLRLLLPIEVAQEIARVACEIAEEAPPPRATSARPAQAPPTFDSFRPGPAPAAEIRNIDLILDIEVEVMVRLGGAVMPLREVQRLRPGSIVDLDKDTEAPMELVVNDKVIAKGELVVVGSDHFALRITEIESPSERIRRLGA